MTEIDYGLAWDFTDPADRIPRQLRFVNFRRNWASSSDPDDGTGQLVAVVADADRPDNRHTITISRPDVAFSAVEAVLAGWDTWAKVTASGTIPVRPQRLTTTANLGEIRRRIHAAGLG